jgi:hypothetical protein
MFAIEVLATNLNMSSILEWTICSSTWCAYSWTSSALGVSCHTSGLGCSNTSHWCKGSYGGEYSNSLSIVGLRD